jgi:uncharacterized protein YqeY
MSLQEDIRADMVSAMKAREEDRLRVLRSLISLFTQELTATKRKPQDKLTDDEVLALVKRSVKQRHEAAEQFRAGGREDLAENEEKEAELLSVYMPEMASKEAIEAVVDAKMKELDITDKTGMGKLMGAVMTKLKGTADGTMVKEIIETKLN